MRLESSFLKYELKRIDTQIKAYRYGGKLEKIMKLWELRKDIVNEIGKETPKEESSFLKDELKRIETQIKAYRYGGPSTTLDTITELFRLRKIIAEEIIKTIKVKGPQVRVI